MGADVTRCPLITRSGHSGCRSRNFSRARACESKCRIALLLITVPATAQVTCMRNGALTTCSNGSSAMDMGGGMRSYSNGGTSQDMGGGMRSYSNGMTSQDLGGGITTFTNGRTCVDLGGGRVSCH